jgi:hypothetical protein
MNDSAIDDLKAKLLSETALSNWSELERFFARGVVHLVSQELDLVEVAYAVSQDNSKQVANFIGLGQLVKVSDDHAREWVKTQPEFWTVVVAPFVLIQLKKIHN